MAPDFPGQIAQDRQALIQLAVAGRIAEAEVVCSCAWRKTLPGMISTLRSMAFWTNSVCTVRLPGTLGEGIEGKPLGTPSAQSRPFAEVAARRGRA